MLKEHTYKANVRESIQISPNIDAAKSVRSPDDAGAVELDNALGKHPAASLYEKMREYKNELLIKKLQSDMKLSRPDALELFEDVKRFIALCATSPAPLGLSRQIDQAWHIFILITKEYARFCEGYCGRYIHHEPSDPYTDLGENYFVGKRRETFVLAETAYGKLSCNWDENTASCTHNCTNGD